MKFRVFELYEEESCSDKPQRIKFITTMLFTVVMQPLPLGEALKLSEGAKLRVVFEGDISRKL